MSFNLFISSLYTLHFIILLSLDNDVLETSKRRAMFYNILSQIFIVKIQYCAKVMRANFDKIRALFSLKFVENSHIGHAKFHGSRRNFVRKNEISQKLRRRIFEQAKNISENSCSLERNSGEIPQNPYT